jgi:hypothetical protein
MQLLELARGPALAFSMAVLVLGLAWRLYGILRRPDRADYSEPRRRDRLSRKFGRRRTRPPDF